MTDAIKTIQLTKTFDETTAVNGVELTVQQGDIYGLLGPNGAGKTTLIKMLTTLLAPTSGYAFVDSYNVEQQAYEVRSRIGYVPQLISADGGLTAYENLFLSACLYGLAKRNRKKRIQEALAILDLQEVAHHLVRTYSGGMIRRLELAQALLHRPSVLFLDEPTIGLDPVARQVFWNYLLQVQKTTQMTIIISTHDMEEADYLCTELAILHRGKIVISGKPEFLKQAIQEEKTTEIKTTLGDVFAHYTGGSIEGGSYQDVKRTRHVAKRLG